jgi:hypothetical protein
MKDKLNELLAIVLLYNPELISPIYQFAVTMAVLRILNVR